MTDTATTSSPDATRLSTQPVAPRDRPAPRRGLLAPTRRAWRQLTSMRTALILLFLLAVASLPGSLLPQRSLNPVKVTKYLSEHRTLGPFFDRIGLFDVFSTPWFAAIYLLLFVSLVGCLIPRIRLHARALRAAPPRAPRHFDRLPESARYEVAGTPDEVREAARAVLRRGRWRLAARDEDGGVRTLSAEKGYLRETGNLVFHIALTALLVGVAAGKLWGYQGTVLVEEGRGFCNAVLQYDAFRPGSEVDGNALAPFCVDLDQFTAKYADDGTATLFRADIRYTEGTDGAERRYPLEVNSPLRIDGTRVYLISHGFAPRFTVRTPSGQEFTGVTAPFVPQDGNLTSEGALKLPDAAPEQLAIEGVFAPAALDKGGGVITSISPQPINPMVGIFVYQGNLGLDGGRPQSVYSIDQRQVDRGLLTKVGSANLRPGQKLTLDDGTVITYDGYAEWASIQVSRDPAQTTVLVSSAFVVLGLILSLLIRRRRVWVRVSPGDNDGQHARTVVQVGGLARTDSGSFATEFPQLVDRLRAPDRAAQPDTPDTQGKD